LVLSFEESIFIDMNPEFTSFGLIISRKYWLESIKERLETQAETESGLLSQQSRTLILDPFWRRRSAGGSDHEDLAGLLLIGRSSERAPDNLAQTVLQ
jgi:hypothetical protein